MSSKVVKWSKTEGGKILHGEKLVQVGAENNCLNKSLRRMFYKKNCWKKILKTKMFGKKFLEKKCINKM